MPTAAKGETNVPDQRKREPQATSLIIRPATALERAAGNPVTEAALTLGTSVAGAALTSITTPLLPLIPVLGKALAARRQEKRMEENLRAIEQVLLSHEAALVRVSDEQYALLNEVVLAAMGSTNDTKLAYLRNAVSNVLALSDLQPQEAVVLGRVVRDMSADEARFLMNHQGVERISIGMPDLTSGLDHHCVDPDSNEALCVYGLLSLGILTPGEAMYDTMGMLGFSRLAPKLVALLRASVETTEP